MYRKMIALILGSLSLLMPGTAQNRDDSAEPRPTLLSAPDPKYPEEVKEASIGGTVTVRVVVDESGAIVSVGDATVPTRLCGGSYGDSRLAALRQSVEEAIKQAKFEPARKDGKPVKSVGFVSSTFDPFQGKPGNLGRNLVGAGVMQGKILSLPKPKYPRAARASRASGPVVVRLVVDE